MAMRRIFVNLKRFDIPRAMGGVCQCKDPSDWICGIIDNVVEDELCAKSELEVVFFLPEALIIPAVHRLISLPAEKSKGLYIGCQGVYSSDVSANGNFGAFTTNRPAAAMKNIGCSWSIIGHSEERKDKFELIAAYDPEIRTDPQRKKAAADTVGAIIGSEVKAAIKQGIKVLACIGETAEEKGDGDFDMQKARIQNTLKSQVYTALDCLEPSDVKENVTIGYEPVWAIGPGKTPPTGEYISFVSRYVKSVINEKYGFEVPVVYGGGLKEENAPMLAGIPSIDGGLVALTRFVGEIGFYPEEFNCIVRRYARGW